jgi:hypothetical protein
VSILSRTVERVVGVLKAHDLLYTGSHDKLRGEIRDAIREGLDSEIRYTRRETSVLLKDALQESARQLRASADTFEMFLETVNEPAEPEAREDAQCSHCEKPLGKVSFVCELVFCDKRCESDWHTQHDPDRESFQD